MITANYTTHYSSPFTSVSNGNTTTGTLIGVTHQRLAVQSVMATLNFLIGLTVRG